MARSRDALVRLWDRHASDYDRRTAHIERRFFAASRTWVCGRAEGQVLEIAIGTGANLGYYPAGVELTGVDWSAGMLAEAARNADSLGLTVDLQEADATALPFADGRFDSVVCTFSLCSIADLPAGLAEAVRVLRPGGDLLLADHVGSTFWPLRALQRAAELVSVPVQGEHFTRRPLEALTTVDVQVLATERLHAGLVERVHARRPLH